MRTYVKHCNRHISYLLSIQSSLNSRFFFNQVKNSININHRNPYLCTYGKQQKKLISNPLTAKKCHSTF